MNISCISDLHIKSDNDPAFQVYQSFMNHSKVVSSDKIYLLGDIFDLMIGDHREYLDKHKLFFDLLAEKVKNNQEVIFVEGNHDFHLEKVFEKFCLEYNLDQSKVSYLKDEQVQQVNNKTVMFCHGDIVDDTNESFKKWKRIYRSSFIMFFVNYILPYFLLRIIGESASKDSKKRNSKVFDYEKAKTKYREGAKRVIEKSEIDILVAGHTHICENETLENGKYLNNGFPLKDKKFVFLSPNENTLISLV